MTEGRLTQEIITFQVTFSVLGWSLIGKCEPSERGAGATFVPLARDGVTFSLKDTLASFPHSCTNSSLYDLQYA